MIAGAIAAITVTALSVGSAFAQTTTFADFTQQSNAKLFVFNNTGSTSTFTATAPIKFTYEVPNGTGFTATQILGTLTMSATVDAPASSSGLHNIEQTFGATTLTFTASTPINGKTNLLTVVATDSALDGKNNSGAPVLSLDGVTFTSDFLDFSNTNERNGALSFSAFNNLSIAGNGYLTSNQGNGTGTFATNPPPTVPTVPEPATTAAMGLGMLGIFGMMFRARKRSTLSVTA